MAAKKETPEIVEMDDKAAFAAAIARLGEKLCADVAEGRVSDPQMTVDGIAKLYTAIK